VILHSKFPIACYSRHKTRQGKQFVRLESLDVFTHTANCPVFL